MLARRTAGVSSNQISAIRHKAGRLMRFRRPNRNYAKIVFRYRPNLQSASRMRGPSRNPKRAIRRMPAGTTFTANVRGASMSAGGISFPAPCPGQAGASQMSSCAELRYPILGR